MHAQGPGQLGISPVWPLMSEARHRSPHTKHFTEHPGLIATICIEYPHCAGDRWGQNLALARSRTLLSAANALQKLLTTYTTRARRRLPRTPTNYVNIKSCCCNRVLHPLQPLSLSGGATLTYVLDQGFRARNQLDSSACNIYLRIIDYITKCLFGSEDWWTVNTVT